MHKGEVDEAITHYRQALALNPNHASIYNNLATHFRQKGLQAEASRNIGARHCLKLNRSCSKIICLDAGDLSRHDSAQRSQSR